MISKALGLIEQALRFNVDAWAIGMQMRVSNIADFESRMHVASAHRWAAALYIAQAIPALRQRSPVSTVALVENILFHLNRIGERDAHFKATSWPTFIAGAETNEPKIREWALHRLYAVWHHCPWGYIFKAIEALKASWRLQDRRPVGVRISWLEEVKAWREMKELDPDCLIV